MHKLGNLVGPCVQGHVTSNHLPHTAQLRTAQQQFSCTQAQAIKGGSHHKPAELT